MLWTSASTDARYCRTRILSSAKSLKEYFADLDTALAIIKEEGNDKILLMAHSTGGLITPYYLDSKKGKLPVDGLILNSPFLDWNFGWMMEKS